VRIKPDKAISLLQDIKDDAADQLECRQWLPASFEGKPVDWDFAPLPGSGLGGQTLIGSGQLGWVWLTYANLEMLCRGIVRKPTSILALYVDQEHYRGVLAVQFND